MIQRVRVFLCSTFEDLQPERAAVLDAIERLQLEHDSMEFFGARAQQAIETCLEEVRRSDILLVIIGHRYGTRVRELGISYSEAEYQAGFGQNKPCLVYMLDESVPVLPKFIERDPDSARLLEHWREQLNLRHTVASFKNANTLAVQVAADLGRTLRSFEDIEISRTRQDASLDLWDEVRTMITAAKNVGLSQAEIISTVRRGLAESSNRAKDLAPTISFFYARYDASMVHELSRALSDQGIRITINEIMFARGHDSLRAMGVEPIAVVINSVQFSQGDHVLHEIEKIIDTTAIAVMFLSSNLADLPFVDQAISLIIHNRLLGNSHLEVLPMFMDETPTPPLLKDVHRFDLRSQNVAGGLSHLLAAIKRHGVFRPAANRPVRSGTFQQTIF